MRILLISANRSKVQMRTIPLGLACVASEIRRAGHMVQMLDLIGVEDPRVLLGSAVNEFDPDLIGISIRNIDDQTMHTPRFFLEEDNQVIELVRKLSKAPIVLGGAGYSVCPQSALTYTNADMGIQGEGEKPFRLLVERLESSASLTGLPGLYVNGKGICGSRAFVKDLDEIPLPDIDLLSADLAGEETVPVQTRRGCAMDCSYCSTATIEGRRVRKRSPERVVEWITRLNEKGVRQLYFVDNTFNLPAPYATRLCHQLIRASLSVAWRCILYPSKPDERLVAAMAESGCVEASIGFESGCERILQRMNKRFTREDVVKSCAMLSKYGIRRMGFLLLGGPGETRSSVEESLQFAHALDLDLLKITVGIRIYPYTLLAEQARKEYLISAGDGLLFPRFYMAPGIEEWTRETVAAYAENRPNWIVDR